MSDLGPCDVCGKPGRWAVVVTGCSEHKIALKAAVENCNSAQHTQLAISALRAALSSLPVSLLLTDEIIQHCERELKQQAGA